MKPRAAAAREEWLRNTILALESGAQVGSGLLATLRRFGAKVPRGRGSDPDDLEYAQPGKDWTEEHVALFWRLVAAVFADRYSDALLNLKAEALGRAASWYLVGDPDIAIVLLARRARALSYASWGEKEVLAAIDAALAVYRPNEHAPAAEHDFILQALEVLDRQRSWRDEDHPRSAEVLALGLRGLEIAGELGGTPQMARLYHSIADALTRDPPPIDAATAARIAALFAGDPAAAAWRRAIDLEDGDFYGEVTADRRRERLEQYAWGLALLDLQRGAIDRALPVLETAGGSCYQRRRHLVRLMRLLAARGVSRAIRLEVLARALRRDLLERELDGEFEWQQAADYAHYGLYQLANLGGGEEQAAIVRAALARPGMAEVIERERRKRAELDAVTESHAARLTDALFARLANQDPEEAEEHRARLLASETPAERAARLAHEAAAEVLAAAGAELLVELLVFPSETGDRVVLESNLVCPEHALEAVRADPAVTETLDALAARVRGVLPGCKVELRVRSLCLAFGPDDDPFTAPALTAAGAGTALAALGLEASPPIDIEAQRARQRRRRSELLFAT